MSNIDVFSSMKLPAHIAALTAHIVDDKDEFGGGGVALPALSIRGKEFRFRVSGQEQATGLREIECIIVRRRERISRRYYAGKYVSGTVDAPTCHSVDGVTPDRGTDKQAASCAECPHSAWGSKVSDNGSLGFACDNYKMLALVPMIGGQLAQQAVSLNLPATSMKRMKSAVGNVMHAKEYFDALKKHNMPAVGVVTRLKFTSAEYPQIAFELVRYATEDELSQAMEMRDSEEVVSAVEGTLVEAENVAIQPAPRPVIAAPAPAAPPKPVAVAKPKPVPKPAPVVVEEPEIVEQGEYIANDEPDPAPAATSEDPMAEVRRLLAGIK